MDWRDYIEPTGEVSVKTVADALGISDNDVLSYARNEGHGARYVGGTSHTLIWKEDAEEIEKKHKKKNLISDKSVYAKCRYCGHASCYNLNVTSFTQSTIKRTCYNCKRPMTIIIPCPCME